MLVSNTIIPYAYADIDTVAIGKSLDPIISQIITPIILFAFGIAVFMFIWGVVEMIRKADEPEARSTGWKHILFGAIGIVIMLSAWGIVYLVSNTLKGVKDSANSGNVINPAQ